MLVQLKVKNLTVNLPMEDSDIFFLLNDKNRQNSLPQNLKCEPTNEYVLMTDITEITIPETNFIIDIENPQDEGNFQLYVLAISSSNSKVVLLGSAKIDVPNFYNSSFQNGNTQTLRKPLLGVQNQKGTVTFELNTIYQYFQLYHKNDKSTESLDKEQTTSSDSYDANIKELNKFIETEPFHNTTTKSQFLFQNIRNADFSQKIIFQEIDLEDSEDDFISSKEINDKTKQNESILNVRKKKTQKYQKSQVLKNIKNRLLQQKFKMQSYLHNLQESDSFMMRIESRMTHYTG